MQSRCRPLGLDDAECNDIRGMSRCISTVNQCRPPNVRPESLVTGVGSQVLHSSTRLPASSGFVSGCAGHKRRVSAMLVTSTTSSNRVEINHEPVARESVPSVSLAFFHMVICLHSKSVGPAVCRMVFSSDSDDSDLSKSAVTAPAW